MYFDLNLWGATVIWPHFLMCHCQSSLVEILSSYDLKYWVKIVILSALLRNHCHLTSPLRLNYNLTCPIEVTLWFDLNYWVFIMIWPYILRFLFYLTSTIEVSLSFDLTLDVWLWFDLNYWGNIMIWSHTLRILYILHRHAVSNCSDYIQGVAVKSLWIGLIFLMGSLYTYIHIFTV